jgi:hypothetical protein
MGFQEVEAPIFPIKSALKGDKDISPTLRSPLPPEEMLISVRD